MLDRKRVESALNVFLGVVIVVLGGIAAKRWFEDTYKPKVFEQPSEHAPALFKVETKVEDGTLEGNDWVKAHFKTPVAAMGEPPQDWSEIEASLSPESCGACHPQQLADWQTSWHHLGMGPGMMGQLVDASESFVYACQRCHAPNAEQYPTLKGAPNPDFVPELRAQGLTCAGCHVRDWTRFGPPTETHPSIVLAPDAELEQSEALVSDEALAQGEAPVDVNEGLPHGGFVAKNVFQDSTFCERCHDFQGNQGKTLNEKRLQETYQEWIRTDFSAEGQTCQSCHMPDGAHSFKGIHDKELVQSGFQAEAKLKSLGENMLPIEAELIITNVGVGHRMPTYTTPRIVLVVEQLDESGQALEGTRQEFKVGRATTPNLAKELYDTRIFPGESKTLVYSAERHPQALRLAARVEVWPDEQYRSNYEIWLKDETRSPESVALLTQARDAAEASRYTAWERTVDLSPVEQAE